MFRASKFAFVDTLVVVLKDVKWFLVFLIFTMWVGLSCISCGTITCAQAEAVPITFDDGAFALQCAIRGLFG